MFFSFLDVKIDAVHICSVLRKNQGMNSRMVSVPVYKLAGRKAMLFPFQICLLIGTVWLPDLSSYVDL